MSRANTGIQLVEANFVIISYKVQLPDPLYLLLHIAERLCGVHI
jgi:hypothetical protein